MEGSKSEKSNLSEAVEAPMNIDQASEFLHKTRASIYTMICRGKLSAHKFGGRLYFFRSELVETIKAGKK